MSNKFFRERDSSLESRRQERQQLWIIYAIKLSLTGVRVAPRVLLDSWTRM